MNAAASQPVVTDPTTMTITIAIAAVRPMRSGEPAHVLHTWAEGYKGSPPMRRKLWRDYKQIDVPVLHRALNRHDTTILVAVGRDDLPLGWIAFASWPSIDAVHWVHTGFDFRRAGVMAALFAAAKLKQRVVYTHQSEVKRGGKDRADQWLARWLAARGHSVSYIPYAEWSR